MGNTSYFLYKRYRVVGSDLVATGEESVDADGTMPLVVRMDDDPSCGFDPPGTRHRTTTGSPYCVGYKKYVDVQYWASYDDGQSWIVTATTNDLVDEYSEDCGYVPPEPMYRWVDSGTTCVGFDKYQRQIKQVSTDDGATWSNVEPPQYSATTLIEPYSEDCGYVPPIYRTTSGTPYCTGYDKYVDVYSQVSYDSGSTWTTTATTPTLVEANSPDCGECVCSAYSYSDTAMTVSSGSSTIFTGITYSGCVKMNVSVTAPGDFIHPSSHSATTEGVWTLNLAIENNTGNSRTGTVTFSLGDTQCQTVTITQERGYVPPTPTTIYRWVRTDDTMCVESGSPTPSYSGQYLTFRALENGTFGFSPSQNYTVSYSLDSGTTWSQLTSGASTPTIASGSTVMWKGSDNTESNIGTFSSTGRFDAEGNAMSLLYGDNFSGQTTIGTSKFSQLFFGCSKLTSAENLVLPATTLGISCYQNMFSGCMGLTTPPQLPATNLAGSCYYGMFKNCYSLTTPPQLPATNLADYCYAQMFYDCTSLTTSPILSATTLTKGCYSRMFYECQNLTTAPVLPATTLADESYFNMFIYCTNLSGITCLATDISANDCTYRWLYNVSSSGTFTKAASMTSWQSGGSGIPSGWTVTNYTS